MKLTITQTTFNFMQSCFPDTETQAAPKPNADGTLTIKLNGMIGDILTEMREDGESDDDLTQRVFSNLVVKN